MNYLLDACLFSCWFYSSTLQMKEVLISEKQVNFCQYKRRHILEDSTLLNTVAYFF
jgi:hypothetical protein